MPQLDRRSGTTRAAPAVPVRPRGPARVTRWLAVPHSLPVELVLVLGLYAVYESTRGLVVGSNKLAIRHADDIVSIERALHVNFEASAQRSTEHVSGLVSALGVSYITLHLAITGLLLIWLHQRRPAVYPFVRTTLLLASGIAVIGFLAFPTAPPRLSGVGIFDSVSGHLPVNLNKGLVSGLYNPYAAVPSMHAGYALIVGATLLHEGRHLVTRLAGVAYPVFVVLVVVATGNHFFFDVGASAFVDVLAAAAAAVLLRSAPAQLMALPSRQRAAVSDRAAA